MEVRVAMALGLVLASAMCGKALADAVRRRARTLEALSEGLQTLRIHMTGRFEPVRNALEHCDCPVMALVAENMDDGASADEAWRSVQKRAARRGGPIDALNDGDRQILDHLFAGLGQSGRREQEALLSGTLRAIALRREGALAKAREADRLYLPLGILTGLMLALVVI